LKAENAASAALAPVVPVTGGLLPHDSVACFETVFLPLPLDVAAREKGVQGAGGAEVAASAEVRDVSRKTRWVLGPLAIYSCERPCSLTCLRR